MIRSHKIALDPNSRQKTYLSRACGVARFSYNWALGEWKKQYKEGLKPTEAKLRKQLNAIKEEQFPWMLEVTSRAPLIAIQNLGEAFKRFFAKKARYPKFKKRGVHDSFSITNDQFKVKGKRFWIPLLGWVRMREKLRFEGKLLSATVSRTSDRWFVSISVELKEEVKKTESKKPIGVDLGLKSFAVLSNGEVVEAPKPLSRSLSRLRMLSKSLSRKVKGSNNFKKAKTKLSKLHYKVSCLRNDFLHKLTSNLTKRFGVIAIEDLNVKGMVRNRHLSRSISDSSWSEFRRQLEYKAKKVLVVDRFFPSSKLCFKCGAVKEVLDLSERVYYCDCGVSIDRDLNAAKNIEAAGLAVIACGDGSSDRVSVDSVKLLSMKQEPGRRSLCRSRMVFSSRKDV